MDFVLTRGEGVQNPKNLADVICERPHGRPSRPLLGLRRVRLSSHLARCPSPAQQSNHAAAADDAECRERYFGDDEMYRLICYTCRRSPQSPLRFGAMPPPHLRFPTGKREGAKATLNGIIGNATHSRLMRSGSKSPPDHLWSTAASTCEPPSPLR